LQLFHVLAAFVAPQTSEKVEFANSRLRPLSPHLVGRQTTAVVLKEGKVEDSVVGNVAILGKDLWHGIPVHIYIKLTSKNNVLKKHTCTCEVWAKDDEPNGRFSSCINSRCRHCGEAWRSLLRVVLLNA
jgi:hypothetical protein